MDKLIVRGTEINVQWDLKRDDFLSLTDIAKIKDSDNPRYIIQNWLRNRNTIEFLGVWETLYNPNFNRVEFDAFRSQAGLNSFVMTPQKWVDATGAIGIVSKAGRYGGTYAHKEIAFEFASWISVEFKLYLVKEFERLKTEEMIDAMKGETVRRLYSVRLRQNEEVKRERVASGMTENVGGDGTVKKRPTKVVKVGRNDLCPCGSGLKWKKCTCKEYHS